LIHVWISTSSAVARSGFDSLLEDASGIVVVRLPREADVILCEELPLAAESRLATPIVLVSDNPFTRQDFSRGVRAVLSRTALPEQIVAALYAAAAGLIAVPTEFSSLIIREATPDREVETLTPREIEALEMLAEGLSNKQIAAGLNISEHTAKFHVNSILSKLRAGTRTEAVMRGIRSGLVKV
jgi:two-component system nitrate/nitrite response regulator NarL